MPTHSSSTPSTSRRRFSLSSSSFISSSSSSSSSSLRRLSTSSSLNNFDQPPHSTTTISTIPFADPPYMPMFKSTIPSSSSSTVMIKELSQGGKKERLSTLLTPTLASQSSSTSSPAPSTPTQGTSRHSNRFFRRLHKRGNGKGELDFGCVGEWNEGPSDLSSSYYDTHKSSNRNSSSSIEFPSLTHSRGHSSSSSLSFSTAASSLPPSPTLPCDAQLGPHPSRVPLSPRAASKKRQTEEAAAVDALNDYFVKVRLSQIEEDGPAHHSITIGDSSYSAPPPPPTSFSSSASRAQGLAIYDTTTKKKMHDRSISADLEIEFIETGHTTFTPLSADSPSYSSAILLPEDAFFNSTHDEGMCYDIDMSAEDEQLSSSTCTSTAGRTPIPEKEIGPALDELSTFFSSPPTSASSPTASQSSRFFSAPSSPHLYSRSRRPDSFQAARQARHSNQPVRYDWI
ncbi:hypothetical protein JCM3765_004023 [Sporobolomyces pararoseus]